MDRSPLKAHLTVLSLSAVTGLQIAEGGETEVELSSFYYFLYKFQQTVPTYTVSVLLQYSVLRTPFDIGKYYGNEVNLYYYLWELFQIDNFKKVKAMFLKHFLFT